MYIPRTKKIDTMFSYRYTLNFVVHKGKYYRERRRENKVLFPPPNIYKCGNTNTYFLLAPQQ